jgi:hypothetical protein
MTERRRAQTSQYAERVNRAVALLGRFPVPAVLRRLARHYQVSSRQARRYVDVAQQHPQGLPVPELTVVLTVKVPGSLVRRLRACARSTGLSLSAIVTRALDNWLKRMRPGPPGGR